MEALALAGLLGVGYVLTGFSTKTEERNEKESFTNDVSQNSAAASASTTPSVDQLYQYTQKNQQQYMDTGSVALMQSFSQPLPSSVVPGVMMNPSGEESYPVYNNGETFTSPLSGVTMSEEDFTHANMVPFFKGQPKQNVTDDANRSLLDHKMGTGFHTIDKREQAPLFGPVQQKMGNVTGLESVTDFMQDRVVTSTNRAFEKPVEPTRVGPGINQGYSSIPTGGFQQFDVLELGKERLSIDALRAESNPRITYEGIVNAGIAIGTQRGEIGEVRHYKPDGFFINENGERNFVGPVSDNLKPTHRSTQVMKFQSRQETNGEFIGPASSVDFSATYTTPSFRAPHTIQQEGYGFRNADGSWAGVANTDAPHNDYGASSIELFANQRSVTGERGQIMNLTGMAAAPSAMTVYDPNDVARTTVRETTGSNNWIGGAVAVGATKLSVYDPTDIVRPTHRNTNAQVDTALNVTRAGIPGAPTLAIPDGVRTTSKESIVANSSHTGGAGSKGGVRLYDTARAMTQNGLKELTAQGRDPLAGNGVKPLFNGKDYVNMSNRKIMTDVFNDRDLTGNRVVGNAVGVESIALQRPKDVLHLDVARDRNFTDVLSALNDNPYALPIHKIAQGTHNPVERSIRSFQKGF